MPRRAEPPLQPRWGRALGDRPGLPINDAMSPTLQTGVTPAESLRQKLRERTATVAVVGLGYVGLPLLRAMHAAGFQVLGYDVDATKIALLREGKTYLPHLGEQLALELARSERCTVTTDPDLLAGCDAVVLCVPTPLGAHREPDLSYVHESTRMVAMRLRPGQLVALESTTYPGTTRGECLPILQASGLEPGREFFLVFSPEREDPGRKDVETRTIPKLVGGIDALSTELGLELYGAAIRTVIPVASAEVAEASKLLENIYRAVNIALVNELKPVLHAMGIDIWDVIAAASTKPFGFQPFHPGPGLGGHCIPIDPFYLTWRAREFGHHTKFIELAGEVNSAMPRYVVARTIEAMNRQGRAARGARALVVGLAYKPDIADTRETPAAEIIHLLAEQGVQVEYHDPHVPVFPTMRRWDFTLTSQALTPELLEAADAVVVVTDHAAIDWQLIAAHARVVVDTRNALQRRGLQARGLLVKA